MVRQLVLLACASAVATSTGCRSRPRTTDSYLFFPPPPANPRVQFLTWASGADQVEPGRGSFESFILGEKPAVQRAIDKPYGVAVRDGVAYVCDTKGLCLCRLDFKNKTYSVIGVAGPGRLRKPLNVVMDQLGYKFVVDPERKQVVVFGPTDKYVTAFDVPQPCRPVDVALYESELFVLDNDESCQIVVMDRTAGKVLRTFGAPGGEPGQFKLPNSLAVSPDGYLYVSDTHNWRIQKLSRKGEPIWAVGTPGYTLGRFGRPRGIRVGPDGIVYVVDGSTEIVQMLDPDGQVLMRFAGPGDVAGALSLPSSLAADATSVPYFQEYFHRDFQVQYLLFVISQLGPRLVNVYAFGSFPDGYRLSEAEIGVLPAPAGDKGIGLIKEGAVPADLTPPPETPRESPPPERPKEQD